MKHIMKIFGVLMLILLTISCKQKEEINVAEMVINKAITHAGGKVLDNATIAFDFRKSITRPNAKTVILRLPVVLMLLATIR